MFFIKKMKEFALDVLFPKICLGCKKEGAFLCNACLQNLFREIEVQKCPVCSFRNFSGLLCRTCRKKCQLTRFLYCFNYKNKIIREAIHAFKYDSVKELGDSLSNFLINLVLSQKIPLKKTMLVLPVPLHPAKLRQRGFNQSEIMASIFARYFGLKIIPDNLTRIKNTDPQIEMPDFKNRRENISNAFKVKRPEEFSGKKIILIDDVSTSLSTLDEAAEVLRNAGAKSVWGLVVARG